MTITKVTDDHVAGGTWDTGHEQEVGFSTTSRWDATQGVLSRSDGESASIVARRKRPDAWFESEVRSCAMGRESIHRIVSSGCVGKPTSSTWSVIKGANGRLRSGRSSISPIRRRASSRRTIRPTSLCDTASIRTEVARTPALSAILVRPTNTLGRVRE